MSNGSIDDVSSRHAHGGKRNTLLMIAFAVIALGLGIAASWPIAAPGALVGALWRAALLFVIMAAFLLLLPGRVSLPIQIFVAMLSGGAAGWLLARMGQADFVADYIGVFGALFILLLKVVIIPLVFVSIVCGVAGIGDARKLGSLTAKMLGYYLATTAVAVSIGLCLVTLIRPGMGQEALRDQTLHAESLESSQNLGMMIQRDLLPAVIQNPVMADQSPLVIIFFAMLLGAALAAIGKEGESALRAFQSLDRALITIILWVMALAPIGVFALMAKAISDLGLQYIFTLAKYCFTVLSGLGAHFCVVVFVICPLFGRVSPLRFLRGMTPAFEVAFSTSSSSATLPVSIDCTSRRIGANRNICGFMLPVGATINMDGTALYVAVASVFVAQVYGINIGLRGDLMIFLTAVMVSVGTAGIPGASIGLMSIIFATVGIPLEGLGIVLGVDRFLDMCRTVVNVTGDCVGTMVISHSEGFPAGQGESG